MKTDSEHIRSNEALWDRRAKSFDSPDWKTNYLRKAQTALVSLLDLKENMVILDVGCGTGWALGQAAARLKGRGQFYGVDLSSKMIDKAKENFEGLDNFHFIKANAESVPLEGNLFDIILCSNSFHHYRHPDKALKEMYRLLKPGGRTCILDPTADHWYIKVVDRLARVIEPEHVRLYSSQEFQRLFVEAGLTYGESISILAHQKIHVGIK
jgi:ubiquinone/menaquinone biosynthesis C-methylase UbiE